MTTSGSTDFTVTRDNIIRDMMLEIGVLDSASDPTATELADASRMLNMMIKNWATFTSLWTRRDVTVTLTPGTASYTIGTGLDISTDRPLEVLEARRRDSSGTEIPIEVYSRSDYMSLPTKSTQAPANGVYYDPQVSSAKLYVWPTGSSGNTTLIITVKRPIEDFDAAGDNPDFPPEWYIALVKNLSVLCHRQFTGRPPDQELVNEAAGLLMLCQNYDGEKVSLRMQV